MSSDIYLNGITYPSSRKVAFPGKDGKEVVFDLPEDADAGLNAYSEKPVQNKVIHAAIQDVRQRQTSPYNFKGSCTFADLPANPSVNDTWYVTDRRYRMTWTGSAWQQSSMEESGYTDGLGSMKKAVSWSAVDLAALYGSFATGTHNGITFTAETDGFTATGTSGNASAFRNVITALCPGMEPGKTLYFAVETSDPNLMFAVFPTDSGGSILSYNYVTEDKAIALPENTAGIVIRAQVPAGKTLTGARIRLHIYPDIYNNAPYAAIREEVEKRQMYPKSAVPYLVGDTIRLADITEDGYYTLDWGWTVADIPDGLDHATGLIVEHFSTSEDGRFVRQTVADIVHPLTTKWFYRISDSTGAFSDWVETGGAGGHENNYVFNEYAITNNVTATPAISTSSNNYLKATGDTRDVTASILTMLSTTGVCNLGPGDFYVRNLDMPKNSAIRGSGAKTRIILSGAEDGYAIRMDSYCTVADVMIRGAAGSIALSPTVGGRHGILWQGNFTENPVSGDQPTYGMIDNCFILGFSGGGITCYDTGYGTYNHLSVTNVDIAWCGAGVNLSYWTEFHKFTNVKAINCWYGVINNGGNNVFVNCEFCFCEIAMLFDNSADQSPNNAHGSVIGCIFGHCGLETAGGSGRNQGTALRILGCPNGEMFSGCYLGYGKLETVDSSGLVFNACEFLGGTPSISIDGGATHVFSGCIFSVTPSISKTGNTKTHFHGCYTRDTGELVEP